jgi:hypothetical protein
VRLCPYVIQANGMVALTAQLGGEVIFDGPQSGSFPPPGYYFRTDHCGRTL